MLLERLECPDDLLCLFFGEGAELRAESGDFVGVVFVDAFAVGGLDLGDGGSGTDAENRVRGERLLGGFGFWWNLCSV